jgi:hypothetical protein
MPASKYGASRPVRASFTRPADTTQYTAGDVVSDDDTTPTRLTFTDALRNAGGSGVIVNASMIVGSNQATAGDYELWVFDAAPTAMEDNAAFDPSDAEMQSVVARLVFDTAVVGDATSGADGNQYYEAATVSNVVESADGNLYGIVVVRNSYTPIASDLYSLTIGLALD